MAKPIPAATADDLVGLRQEILRRIAPLVRAAGLAEHEVDCTVLGTTARATVVLTGPGVTACMRQALGVRVLDAVHADGRTFGRVDIDCRFGPAAG